MAQKLNFKLAQQVALCLQLFCMLIIKINIPRGGGGYVYCSDRIKGKCCSCACHRHHSGDEEYDVHSD